MLKACCDCITAGIREQNDAYGAESIQLNGRSPRAPSWPAANSNKEKMFLLPKNLEDGDRINITCLISHNPHWISVSLITEENNPNGTTMPDYNNTASQLYVNFDSDEGNGTVTLKTITNGITDEFTTNDIRPSELFPESNTGVSEVTIHIVVKNDGIYEIEYYIDESYIERIPLKHTFNKIRYLVLDGDVEKVKRLDFIFA